MSSAPPPTPEPAGPPRTAPSGQTPQPARPWWRPPGWIILVALVLFALNYWAATRATEQASRIRVPYSPFFIQQVTAGHVASITTRREPGKVKRPAAAERCHPTSQETYPA